MPHRSWGTMWVMRTIKDTKSRKYKENKQVSGGGSVLPPSTYCPRAFLPIRIPPHQEEGFRPRQPARPGKVVPDKGMWPVVATKWAQRAALLVVENGECPVNRVHHPHHQARSGTCHELASSCRCRDSSFTKTSRPTKRYSTRHLNFSLCAAA